MSRSESNLSALIEYVADIELRIFKSLEWDCPQASKCSACTGAVLPPHFNETMGVK